MKQGVLGFLLTILVVLTIGLLAQITAAISGGPMPMSAGPISLQQDDNDPDSEDSAAEESVVEEPAVEDRAAEGRAAEDSAAEDSADSSGDTVEGAPREAEGIETDMAAKAATAATTVNLAEDSHGALILTDGQGRPFYTFTGTEEPADLAGFVPVESGGADAVGAGLEQAQLGTLVRQDGSIQLTYVGRPLYHQEDAAQVSAAGAFAYVGPEGEHVAVATGEEATARRQIAVVVGPETTMATVNVGENEKRGENSAYIMPVAGAHLAAVHQADDGSRNGVNVMPVSGISAAQSLSPRYLSIPSIGVETEIRPVGYRVKTFADGTRYKDWDVASHAAGWHNTSALPGAGDNVVISGHNNIQGAVFRELYKVETGDTIALWQHHRMYLYRVDSVQILPEKGESLAVRAENARWIGETDAERLTLVSCWPEWSNTHRVVVTASPLPALGMR